MGGLEIGRREFLRLAGLCAGAMAAGPLLPRLAGAGQASETTIAATGVLRPAFAAPVIIEAGAAIPFEKAGDTDVTINALWLQPAGGGEKITLESIQGSANQLTAGKPLAPGLYDLYSNISRGGSSRDEHQPHAVKVVDAFKKDFIFAVMSDVHFGDMRLQSQIPGFDVAATLKKEIEIMNKNQVEFCLCCGDLCFIPPKTKNELRDYVEELGALASFPVFTVPGNHDGYASGAAGKIQYDTFTHWRKMFGPLNYVAGYGDITLIGINTYDKAPRDRNLFGGLGDTVDTGAMDAGELAWLESSLKRAREQNPSGAIIVFGHHNPTNTVKDVNGLATTVPFSETGRKELLALFEKYKPEYYFCGHVHGIYEETYAKTKIITVPTAGSRPAEGHPVGFYLAHFSNGKIADLKTVEIVRP